MNEQAARTLIVKIVEQQTALWIDGLAAEHRNDLLDLCKTLTPSKRIERALEDLSMLAVLTARHVTDRKGGYSMVSLEQSPLLEITFHGEEHWGFGGHEEYSDTVPVDVLDDPDGGLARMQQLQREREEREALRKAREQDGRERAVEQRERAKLAELRAKYPEG